MEQPNLNYVNQLSGTDNVFKAKLITIIKKEFPDEKALYFENMNNKKFKEAAGSVHKLKHKISILGLENSYEIAVKFEENLLENRTIGKEDFDAIITVITNYLKTL